MLDKTFRPQEVEREIYADWEQSGAFKAGAIDKDGAKDSFAIVIPPPNVTGNLHMGHALNNTLQDVMVRYNRMKGKDTLWQPGTDHAGIATQMVVERQLAAEGISRHDLGREEFIRRVWQWKEKSGGSITNQLRRLGASCDWSRERFTMDEGLSAAVRKVFVSLYKDGLIYRDKRLVNWDCKLLTAISDLEVEQREVRGHMWHIRYPLEGREGAWITVATTRPETMLGDTAVAVHPEDERYRDLVGAHVILPLVGRRIPIVADEYADPEQGSGAVKITPAHDFNDFEVGRRHDLEMINIFDAHACLNDRVPEPYRGLSREEARERIVADLEAQGLLERIEDITHIVPYGDRSGVVIEPWLTDQWFVDAARLAGPAIEAVESGRIKFVPRNWENTYFEWMRNIQPWCISRQIWWGHQIPAWFGPDGTIFVEETEEEAQAAAAAHYGKAVELRRETDVLDTWFSSALWPFSTLGWPEDTAELARYYPTDVLVTGFDIIFFWVARMVMMGMRFMDKEPFHTVYIHALVRDEKGQKMSKSKGNVMDPLEFVDEYGADALRFTLTAMAAQGRDIKLSKSRVEGYRNFGTKLWNAARFCQMNECSIAEGFDLAKVRTPLNRWIVGEVVRTERAISQALADFRFNEAAGAVYKFVWGQFCDWYLELAKPALQGEDEEVKAETRATAAWVLEQILRLLHPFMPFITEALWQQLNKPGRLILQRWPDLGDELQSADADAEIDWVIRLIGAVRGVRSEMNVPPGARVPVSFSGMSAENMARLNANWSQISRLARLERLEGEAEAGRGTVQIVHDEATVILPLGDVIDIEQEVGRLQKAIAKCERDMAGLSGRLNNEKFIAKAPAHVVEEQRARLQVLEKTAEKLRDALKRLA